MLQVESFFFKIYISNLHLASVFVFGETKNPLYCRSPIQSCRSLILNNIEQPGVVFCFVFVFVRKKEQKVFFGRNTLCFVIELLMLGKSVSKFALC